LTDPGEAAQMPTDSQILDAMTEQIRLWSLGASVAFYRAGHALLDVRREERWKDGAYSSFSDYLRHGVGLPRSTAYRLMQVAETFGESIAATHSLEQLRGALDYLSAADIPPSDQALVTEILIPASEGEIRRRLTDASPTQIRAAIEHLRAPPEPRPEIRVPVAVERALQKAVGEDRPSGGLVSVRLGEDGEFLMSLHNIPMGRMKRFVRALARLRAAGSELGDSP